MANHAHEPDDEKRRQVAQLSGYGMPEKHIARFIGIAEKTLRKYYREELDVGMSTALCAAAEGLYKLVAAGNLTAIIFYLKTKGGFREKIDLSNEDGSLGPPLIIKRVFVDSAEEVTRIQAVIDARQKQAQQLEDDSERTTH